MAASDVLEVLEWTGGLESEEKRDVKVTGE